MPALRRVFLILLGYLCSVPVFYMALVLLFAIAAWVMPEQGWWVVAAVSPAIIAGALVTGLFLIAMIVVMSAVPAFLMILFAEWFAWTSLWVYGAAAAAVAGGAYWYLSPRTIGGLGLIGMIELGLFMAAGLLAGLVYWLIAGRRAGLWR